MVLPAVGVWAAASPILRELQAQQEGSGEAGVMPPMGNASEGPGLSPGQQQAWNWPHRDLPTGPHPQHPDLGSSVLARGPCLCHSTQTIPSRTPILLRAVSCLPSGL